MSPDDTSSFIFPFHEELKNVFYDQMERRTSAFLFGSAATGNWVAGRSDLDVAILISREQTEALGEAVRKWNAVAGHPILDGFAFVSMGNGSNAIRLEDFQRVAFPAEFEVKLIDLWNIKYRSKHSFGDDFIGRFRNVDIEELRDWARTELKWISGSGQSGQVPEVEPVLSKLVWIVSYVGRLLMLSRGTVCDSKKVALQWLTQEYIEIREPVSLLLSDFNKSDSEPIAITSEQSEGLRRFLVKASASECELTG